MRQWHPIAAHFLRRVFGDAFEVLTNLAVNDVPREADIVVLRRQSAAARRRLTHLWRWLTFWNILEFKGPTVTPREFDLDKLVEVGIGVVRRLNEQREKDGLQPIPTGQISFWYIARKLTKRRLQSWDARIGKLTKVEAGVWRGYVCGYSVYFVSSVDTSLDPESLPLHLVGAKLVREENVLARYVRQHAQALREYVPWMYALHTAAWKREQTMAGNMINENLEIDWNPVVEEFGVPALIGQIGIDRVIDEVGLSKVIAEVGLSRVVKEVGLAKVIEEVGLANVIEEVGLAKVVEEVGLAKVVEEVGLAKVIEEVGVSKVVEEVGLAKVIEEVGVSKVVEEVGLAKLLDEIGNRRLVREVGIDRLLDGLTPEERATLKRRL